MVADEFTCVCPMTGQPDFATIRIRYVPDQLLVELKSLKQYLWSYRQEGAFHEDVTNRILDDFVAAAGPRWIEVTGDFKIRGGIKTDVRAVYGKRPDLSAASSTTMWTSTPSDAANTSSSHASRLSRSHRTVELELLGKDSFMVVDRFG